MTPRESGELVCKGKINTIKNINKARKVLETAAENALNAIKSVMESDERICRIL